MAKTETLVQVVFRRDRSKTIEYRSMDDATIREGCLIMSWQKPLLTEIFPIDQIASITMTQEEVPE